MSGVTNPTCHSFRAEEQGGENKRSINFYDQCENVTHNLRPHNLHQSRAMTTRRCRGELGAVVLEILRFTLKAFVEREAPPCDLYRKTGSPDRQYPSSGGSGPIPVC